MRDNNLVLTNVPVPKSEKWEKRPEQASGRFMRLKEFLSNLIPHFIHDVTFSIYDTFYTKRLEKKEGGPHLSVYARLQQDREMYDMAEALIKKVNHEVKAKGGKLVVVAVPSIRQFIRSNKDAPYQLKVESICKDSDIPYLDLAPYFKKTFFRTYYRKLAHWNARGNKVAAKAIYSYLRKFLE